MAVSHAGLQAEFAAALRDPSPDAAPTGLCDVSARRFRVYRNNVRMALIEALAAAYPAVLCIVDMPFFEQMASVFIADRPARERTLNLYGAGFADFLQGFAPARDLPYLPDVARLERAVIEARHAADAPVLDPAALAALGDGLAAARLVPHPAARLVRSDYPVADIWRANTGETQTAGDLVFAAGAAGALVLRPGLSVTVESLTPERCAFAEALIAGDALEAAHAAAAAANDGFDVIEAFRTLLTAGAFSGVAGEALEGGQA